MNEPRLEHKPITIKRLIEDYRAGKIVIPEFQREYVWKRSKAPLLIDSLYRGYPVSSLLLWQSSDEVRSRKRDPRPSRTAQWLIDGQQRVTTLSNAMNGDAGIDIMFNPNDETFALSNAATRNTPGLYRLAEIWDPELYLEIRRNLQDHNRRRIEPRLEKVRRLLDYEIPVVYMIDHSFDDAVKAFERINTLGVKLKVEDINSAKVAAKHTGFIADEVVPFLEEVRRQGFERMNVMHLFRVCAFLAHPDGRNRTPLHELDKREVLTAWKETKRATKEAIELVRTELGLMNMNILWSGALMVPVITLCAIQPRRERNSESIAGWIAVASLMHRYSKAVETALDQDLKACRSSDPIRALLANIRKEEGPILSTPEDFRGAIADRGGMLAMYIACRHRGARDLSSGQRIHLQSDIDRHHILPRAQFDDHKSRVEADCLANIAFITSTTNKSIGAPSPEVYLPRSRKYLSSQCIPEDEALWRMDKAEDFWAARRVALSESFNEFVKTSLPNRRKLNV